MGPKNSKVLPKSGNAHELKMKIVTLGIQNRGMKNWMLLSFLCCFGLAGAQTNTFRQMLDDASVSFGLGFEKYDNLPQTLIVASPITGISNRYLSTDKGFLLTNVGLMQVSPTGIVIDSFNPNGAINMPTALGMGLVRTVFKL